MTHISRILVPVDFNNGSLAALQVALALARDHGAVVELLHVVEALPLHGMNLLLLNRPADDNESLQESLEAEARENLEAMLSRVKDADRRRLSKPRLVWGEVPRAIVEAAEVSGVDLIIMATHGRTGLARAFWGSVAEKVVRWAACPVVTIKEKRAA